MEAGRTSPARSFRDLIAWQKVHELVLLVYRLTLGFPPDERFGLTSQIRRAAVSVAANIAEGFSKRGKADKAHFFNTAQGSLEEVHYYLILTKDLGYADTAALVEPYRQVARLLGRYTSIILASNS